MLHANYSTNADMRVCSKSSRGSRRREIPLSSPSVDNSHFYLLFLNPAVSLNKISFSKPKNIVILTAVLCVISNNDDTKRGWKGARLVQQYINVKYT